MKILKNQLKFRQLRQSQRKKWLTRVLSYLLTAFFSLAMPVAGFAIALAFNQKFVTATEPVEVPTITPSDRLSTAEIPQTTVEQIVQQSSAPIQGNKIALNNVTLTGAWMQWQEGQQTRLAIADTDASSLGVELLSTNNPALQPISWFSSSSNNPILQTRFANPYRYLDVTDLLAQAGARVQALGDTLKIDFTPAKIENIRLGTQTWGQRIVLDLDRPTFWQVSQARDRGVVILPATAVAALFERFPALPTTPSVSETEQEDAVSPNSITESEPSPLSLESKNGRIIVHLNLTAAKGLRVWSLPSPNRLVIDITDEPMSERDIRWMPGVLWRQKYINLEASRFPVVWLEIDRQVNPNIQIEPIWASPEGLSGTKPLVTLAREAKALAAINGGFFNRNNQLPLGAIRREGIWYSGPILNRGAIAWNNHNQIKFDRLSLRETLTTSVGQRLPVLFLNSGYVQAGIARYTPAWGANYTTLIDNEIVVVVENNLITQQLQAGKAGEDSFAIPSNGYLLTLRAYPQAANYLPLGTTVNITSVTVPEDFANYPQILGAGPLLVKNRQIVLDPEAEKFSQSFSQQTAIRSAIATSNNGTLIIATVHGRVAGKGPNLQELAQLMQLLGAVDALNLDGGSSTSLYLGGQLLDRSPVTAARIHNGIGIFLQPLP
ncbi:MAG: phosphodiester glycosidase family protein [Oscillatoria sp. PMC 1051.18]|nr:phosphodiester glycosidase family protein [Oscillatoria sp. PMC 1050.18]MEC5031133.1 phosphodiester glycosidase family protein [Oscillatoria sp. PMC 1051.18]